MGSHPNPVVSARCHPELHAWVRAEARRRGLSVSELVVECLERAHDSPRANVRYVEGARSVWRDSRIEVTAPGVERHSTAHVTFTKSAERGDEYGK